MIPMTPYVFCPHGFSLTIYTSVPRGPFISSSVEGQREETLMQSEDEDTWEQ